MTGINEVAKEIHESTEWKSTDCFGWTLESPYTD